MGIIKNKAIVVALVLSVLITSCYKEESLLGYGLDDWSEATHEATIPDYSIVFNQEEVGRLDIVIGKEYWEAQLADLEAMYGGGAPKGFAEDNPIYVPCQVFFNGLQWYDVGLRFKGNSSLRTAYTQDKMKFPMRLEFDHFENENPLISGQTFYGFSQLSLANSFKDKSTMREKIADDLYREFGVPVARSAFYRIYVDHGDGPVYFGLYTMVEIVFDTMVETEFGGSTGNCYKGEGSMDGGPGGGGAAKFGLGFMDSYWEDFEVKIHGEDETQDIIDMWEALHDPVRTTDAAKWRSKLEALFDVDGFLKWLAANTTMQNWDAYGVAPHNYYIYHSPSDDRLHWIPWDNNETFLDQPNTLKFDFANIANEPGPPPPVSAYPLISFLYADAEYRIVYDDYIRDFISGPFEPGKMATQYNAMADMVRPYVSGSEGEQIPVYSFLDNPGDFDNELNYLINHVSMRYTQATAYLPL